MNQLAEQYPLHNLGWKAFQDICIGVAEECLQRPVQSFLPNNDAGRDGAFVGKWDGDNPAAGESTIQCKFTSRIGVNLTLSLLKDELEKVKRLAEKGLANDYIILTNHPVTGESDLAIRSAFQKSGVGRCRIFGNDWIIRQIRSSPRLRMMSPRLYGLGDLREILDERAYGQARLILSAMGEDLQRLVITEAHRQSVRAISQHNLVLLLGEPAAGKSTIGASIAIGAADIWQSKTIRVTSPDDLKRHLDEEGSQFFWIDDAWGNTQYQRQTAEAWNQIFPFMQGAMRKGSRFLITSRTYIWNSAVKDLKLQAMPILKRSQVIINVHELSTSEKAQILYNHIKLGDQPKEFRKAIKPLLPSLAERDDFLPETARRLGSTFFADGLKTDDKSLTKFFAHPETFLQETISNLSAECRAAIGVIFLNGGQVRSPVSTVALDSSATAFGVSVAAARTELEAMNGSILLLIQDEVGSFWTYKHPTIADAFASYLATSPELLELYIRGANPDSILSSVACAGTKVQGAILIPDSLHELLAARIASRNPYRLKTFLSYRSNAAFARLMLTHNPGLLNLPNYGSPIRDDLDASFVSWLYSQGLLPEVNRKHFAEAAKDALVENADASIYRDAKLAAVLTKDELEDMQNAVKTEVLPRSDHYIRCLSDSWNHDYSPEDYFDELESDFSLLITQTETNPFDEDPLNDFKQKVRKAVRSLDEEYEPPSSTSAPVGNSVAKQTGLDSLFRDIDE